MEKMEIFWGLIVSSFVILTTAFLLLIWKSSVKHSYWKKKGIPFVKPFPVVGSVVENMRRPVHELELERYSKLGRIYGFYEGMNPVLVVGDPKLARDILLKDFPSFANRRKMFGPKIEIGDGILFNILPSLVDEDWKRVRSILSPTLSTGKVKKWLHIFKTCSQTLAKNFKMAAEKGEPVNTKKLFGTFTVDTIASSAFSTKIDSHNNPENKFVQMSRELTDIKFSWRFVLLLVCPRLMGYFGINPMNPGPSKYFIDLTHQIIKERKKTGQRRNDFLQLMIDTLEEGDKDEKEEDTEKESDPAINYGEEIAKMKVYKNYSNKTLSIIEVVAQSINFFLSGYVTTSAVLSVTSYLLATNEDDQEKARQEITEVLKETNGEFTYEALKKMKYLDNIISESLRLYPPGVRIERTAEVDYKLGDTGITIPKGMMVTIPVYALQKDSNYFPNPEKFDPSRFTAEERAKRDPYVYMPFGAGPRNCIAIRFVLLEMKLCLAYIISCFNIKTCPETEIPLKLSASLGLLQPSDVLLKMEQREDCPFA